MVSNAADKSALTFSEPKRARDKDHLRYVASQPCVLCSTRPSDAHHLRFAQPRAMGRKVSDEFTVPLCRTHHRELHHGGNEAAWWHDMGIDPLAIAREYCGLKAKRRKNLNLSSSWPPRQVDQRGNYLARGQSVWLGGREVRFIRSSAS